MKLSVGVFVVVLFLTVVGAGLFLLKEKGFFDKKYNYYFTTQSAAAFSVGMPLKFSGFDIGVIEEISLKDDGEVLIRFTVNEQNRRWISEGTELLIKKPLIGSPHIVVHSHLGAKPLKSGATLKMIKSDDINDMISKLEPVVNKLISIINNIDAITKYLASGDSDLLKMLKNLEAFSEKLAQDDSLLTTITGDKHSTQTIKEAIDNLAQVTKDIKNISASLDKDIVKPSSESIEELHEIMKDIRKKLQILDGTVKEVGDSTEDIKQMKKTLHLTIEKSNQMINKVDAMLGDEKIDEVELP